MIDYFSKIAGELQIGAHQVKATVEMLDEGGTVPFISRYRKERTGSLDEVFIRDIRDRIQQLRDLDKRRSSILEVIKDQGKLTPELKAKIEAAEIMSVLEDLYLPYKPKRRTRATIAKEKGLEPLATMIFDQENMDVILEAAKFLNPEKEVNSEEEALKGARDIIAEWINEDQEARQEIRELFQDHSVISAKVISGKEEEAKKFKDYFEFQEGLKAIPSHRLLAVRRGEKEGFLRLDIAPEETTAIEKIQRQFVSGQGEAADQVAEAAQDSYKRLMKLSMETEFRINSKKLADIEAIEVFADNLKQLLLAAPLGQKRVMGVDPGFYSGCKVVCLDAQGKLLEYSPIYPNEPQKKTMQAEAIIRDLVKKHKIEAIAVGNGTASRETEKFIKSLKLGSSVLVNMVSETGASVYSASDIAREEFPDQDLTVRGAISIGRRMMDPLAELVKIDPKSIGVGQYQHDVDQNLLKGKLDDVVMSCVNAVGVELNTASQRLLTYVSGLGPQLANNILQYRNEHGAFKKRSDLKKVPRLGDKAFEQAAGFLRIRDGVELLDRSTVHPERYGLVQKMAKDLGTDVSELMSKPELRKRINLNNYTDDEVGLPTLEDIMAELDKPGRDPREQFEAFAFSEEVNEIDDLRVGMKLPGIVTNITKFGAFVDVGVHQDGLVHVSQMADKFIKDPLEVVKLSQKVMVTVTELDIPRKRISMSMKREPFAKAAPRGERKPRRADESADKKPRNNPPRKPRSRSEQSRGREVEGDLQTKLARLKGKFNS